MEGGFPLNSRGRRSWSFSPRTQPSQFPQPAFKREFGFQTAKRRSHSQRTRRYQMMWPNLFLWVSAFIMLMVVSAVILNVGSSRAIAPGRSVLKIRLEKCVAHDD